MVHGGIRLWRWTPRLHTPVAPRVYTAVALADTGVYDHVRSGRLDVHVHYNNEMYSNYL